jgi:hypothetical protein
MAADAQTKAAHKEVSTAYLARAGRSHQAGRLGFANGNSNGWARRLWILPSPISILGPAVAPESGTDECCHRRPLALKESGKLSVDIQSDGDLLMTSFSLTAANIGSRSSV